MGCLILILMLTLRPSSLIVEKGLKGAIERVLCIQFSVREHSDGAQLELSFLRPSLCISLSVARVRDSVPSLILLLSPHANVRLGYIRS